MHTDRREGIGWGGGGGGGGEVKGGRERLGGGYLWRKDTEVNILPADNVVVSILQIARIKFAWHKFDKYQNQKSVKA